MAFDDTQMDVLLRRYSQHATSNTSIEHLDADEMNAFAEGSLPAAARQHYVSHLADCDQCRQMVTQLTISAGRPAAFQAAGVAVRESWGKKLTELFRPARLRYAAFASILIIAGVLTFLLMRQTERNPQSDLVARNEQPPQISEAKPEGSVTSENSSVAEKTANHSQQESTPKRAVPSESGESKNAEAPGAPPKIRKEVPQPATLADKTASATPLAAPKPAFAPPPPGETERAGLETKGRNRQQDTTLGGARQSGVFGTAGVDRKQNDQLSTAQMKDDNTAARNQPPPASVMSEKAKDSRREGDNATVDRGANESRAAAPKTVNGKKSENTDEVPETRTINGHKFRHQDGAWIDSKFKSSMTVKYVSRDSQEFAALDSEIRSIAQRLTGQVIIVWKGKAYAIR